MISRSELEEARTRAAKMLGEAGVVFSDEDLKEMDVADFGLSRLQEEGAQILSLAETDKVALRVIALFPGQTEPEHCHIGFEEYEGKQETLRVIKGSLYLYLPGEDTRKRGVIPKESAKWYTVHNERILRPNDVITIPVGERHWFQGGPEGAVFFTLSTKATDSLDPFTNPQIVRKTRIAP